MTASEIQVSETALDYLEKSYNAELATLPFSPADARETLRQIAAELRDATGGSGGDLTRAVVYTVSMKNRSSGETEHMETITIRPGK